MSHDTHMNGSCHTYEWVMSHVWMSHVAHMNESCRTGCYWMRYGNIYVYIICVCPARFHESWHSYEWVMSHVWMSHVTRMNEMSHVAHMNESCYTGCYWMRYGNIYVYIICVCPASFHTWISQIPRINESCLTFDLVVLHVWVSHTYMHIAATHCNTSVMTQMCVEFVTKYCTATHCNTLQHTATHCNTLQHTATHCNTLLHTATRCSTLQHVAEHCNKYFATLKHAITTNGRTSQVGQGWNVDSGDSTLYMCIDI